MLIVNDSVVSEKVILVEIINIEVCFLHNGIRGKQVYLDLQMVYIVYLIIEDIFGKVKIIYSRELNREQVNVV